jgi:SAM-dependent methyltransferase
MSAVQHQYTNWIYPIPIEDMRSAIAHGSYWEIGDPLLYHSLFWPHKRDAENLDILVAGCGSVQAAYYACRNPNWNVTGIDLSEPSLAHQQKLKDRHGLKNLRLKQLDITKVSELGESYDFIVSTGVLHHLPDPDLGIAALRNVLRPEGVINLMVYGKSLRLGVYMMQEVFRLLGFQQTQADVDIVKATIHDLSSEHVLTRYIKFANDLHYDAAYVDTFLHPQDRAYNVNEVYEFTRRAGLEFLTWCDPLEYSLEANVPADHPLWNKLTNLKPETAAHICDLLTQMRGTHRWAAAHPDYVKKMSIPFDTEELLNCSIVSHRLAKFKRQVDLNGNPITVCERGKSSYSLHYRIGEIIDKTNGVKSLQQVMAEMTLSPEEKSELDGLLRNQLKSLWMLGHIHILLPEAKTG